jgi:hypothetical protein
MELRNGHIRAWYVCVVMPARSSDTLFVIASGIIMWEVATGAIPYQEENLTAFAQILKYVVWEKRRPSEQLLAARNAPPRFRHTDEGVLGTRPA